LRFLPVKSLVVDRMPVNEQLDFVIPDFDSESRL